MDAEQVNKLKECLEAALKLLGGSAASGPVNVLQTDRRKRERKQCTGCVDFECVSGWKSVLDLPNSDDEMVTWAEQHGLLRRSICNEHPNSGVKVKSYWVGCCQNRNAGEPNACRRSIALKEPLMNVNGKLKVLEIIKFWAHLANGEAEHCAASNANINKNTASQLVLRICNAVNKYHQMQSYRFEHCVVDETFIGRRLHHVGKRVRVRGIWFVTVTERCRRTGKSGRTVWKAVKKRDKKTLTDIVKKTTIGSKSVVFTDCFKGYIDLPKIVRHATVDHSREFKSQDSGTHTNNAEGCHGTVKSMCRKLFFTFGKNTRDVKRKLGFCTALWNTGEENKFGGKMQVLMRAAKLYYVPEDADGTDTMSSCTVESYDATEFIPPTPNSRKTATKKPTQDPTETTAEAIVKEIAGNSNGWVVVDPKQWGITVSPTSLPHAPRGLIMPLWCVKKWMLAVVKTGDKVIVVYDPKRSAERCKRKALLTHVAACVSRLRRQKHLVHLKRCTQLERSSATGSWVAELARAVKKSE